MVNISSFLAVQSKARLRELAGHWDLGETAPHLGRQQLAMALAQRMSDRWAVADQFERLSPHALSVVLATAGHPGNRVSPALLSKELSLSEKAVAPAVAEAVQHGFLWPPAGYLMPATNAKAHQVDILQMPDELARAVKAIHKARVDAEASRLPLREAVNRLDDQGIARLAERWRIDHPRHGRKREQVNALLVTMLDQHALTEAVADAGATAGRLVAVLSETETQLVSTEVLAAAIGQSAVDVRAGLRSLADLGLAQATYAADGQRLVYLPADVVRALKTASTETTGLPALTEPPAAEVLALPHLLLDMLTFLSFVRLNVPKLTVDGRIPKRTLTQLNKQLIRPLDENEAASVQRFNLLLNAASARELLARDDVYLLPGLDLPEWENLSFAEQNRQLLNWWLHELYAYDGFFGYGINWIGMHAGRGRQRVAAWLHRLEPGRWYGIDALIEAIKQRDPMILRSRPEVIQYLGYKGVENLMKVWDEGDGQVLRQMLTEPFHWFNVLDLGHGPDGKPMAIRLTELGAWLLGEPGQPAPAQATDGELPLVVQPNFEVLALTLDAPTLYRLARYAEFRRADRVAWYELTKASVLLAFDRGATIDQLLDLLNQRSRTGIPQNVEFTLRDWSRGFQRLYIEPAVLLEVDDPAVLDNLQRSKHGKKLGRRLSPTVALMDTSVQPDTFINALRKDGFFAQVRLSEAEIQMLREAGAGGVIGPGGPMALPQAPPPGTSLGGRGWGGR